MITLYVFCRPFFTYWVTFVQILVMIVVSAVYGFAPFGLDHQTETALVGSKYVHAHIRTRAHTHAHTHTHTYTHTYTQHTQTYKHMHT